MSAVEGTLGSEGSVPKSCLSLHLEVGAIPPCTCAEHSSSQSSPGASELHSCKCPAVQATIVAMGIWEVQTLAGGFILG